MPHPSPTRPDPHRTFDTLFTLFRQANPRVLYGALALIAAAAVIAAARSKGANDLFMPIAALVTLAVGLFLAWLSGI